MVLVRTLFFNQTALTKANLFCSKRKYVVYRLYIRSVPPSPSIHSTSSPFIKFYLFIIYFLVLCILRSTRCSSRLSRSEPTAEYAERDHIQWHLGFRRRHTRFLPPRKTSTTRTGRANVRGTRGNRCKADPDGRVSSKGVVRENMNSWHFMGDFLEFAILYHVTCFIYDHWNSYLFVLFILLSCYS